MNNFSIAIHGGAGTLVKGMMTPQLEIEYKQALKEALDKGYQVLEQGKTAVEAVEQAVIALEDSHLFNVGGIHGPFDGADVRIYDRFFSLGGRQCC